MRAILVAVVILAITGASAQAARVWLYGNNGYALGSANHVAPVGCTNQLVLQYSNSCALIGQAWGQ